MLSIEITKDAERKVREFLREYDEPYVRVRSFTVGQA
jgi:Fe-S cluster assembly iron-binding protein IscA